MANHRELTIYETLHKKPQDKDCQATQHKDCKAARNLRYQKLYPKNTQYKKVHVEKCTKSQENLLKKKSEERSFYQLLKHFKFFIIKTAGIGIGTNEELRNKNPEIEPGVDENLIFYEGDILFQW